ncbi:MAG: glutamate--tRNA ligase [Parcubacteria group bacterium]|nr:glutamate--tRNA ligase [Parcubacteria group bacterium]
MAIVRTRVAPSPTGHMHIGTVRTGLFNYLFAKAHHGAFLLRIEDTDPVRSKPEYEAEILKGFKWLGLEFDEGPNLGGNYGPYRQSERLDLYREKTSWLLDNGLAYQCFCTEAELEKVKEKSAQQGLPPRYSGKCRTRSRDERLRLQNEGQPFTVRLIVPREDITFTDLIHGAVTTKAEVLDDFVIVRSDDTPLYNFTAVIDDHAMAITHVIRGEDHLSNTPKQIILYRALGWELPVFAHLPLLLNPDKSKMSKRFGDVELLRFRDEGYLSQALINFLAFLGWNPKTDREFFTLPELISAFHIEQVNKAGAIFNRAKLDYFNQHYVRALPLDRLIELSWPYLENAGLVAESTDRSMVGRVLTVVRDRIRTLSEVPSLTDFFFLLPAYDPALLTEKGSKATAKQSLEILLTFTEKEYPRDLTSLTDLLKLQPAALGISNGEFFWPTRVALAGKAQSPSTAEMMMALGNTETQTRLRVALSRLET